MKKIYKVTNWDASNFSSDNVLNKTHWFVKALDIVLTALDIGAFSLSYVSTTDVKLTTTNYGDFTFQKPTTANSTQYIFYVDSENKELFGCCSYMTSINVTRVGYNSSAVYSNFLRGCFVNEYNGAFTTRNYGGYLGIKFANSKIIGRSTSDVAWSSSAKNNLVVTGNQIGVPFGNRYQVKEQPLTPVEIYFAKYPLYEQIVEVEGYWNKEFFTNIYETEDFYLGALRSDDGKQFIYAGYMFEVDDANSIGIIETTI